MNIKIRPLKLADADISFNWRNDPYIWEFTGRKPDRQITLDIEREWLTSVLQEKNSARFAIMADDVYVGNIQITNIIQGVEGEYHIFIGEKEYWGKGIATIATNQIISFAKTVLKLQRIYLKVNPKNIAAIKVYLKCGFKEVPQGDKMELIL